ncbi:MAG: 2,3-diphosphoglycerate-dependent phosphoglycerate mutase [Patescibacteria group bacterium]|nr:2,3-diphosphoglycerate-dependent phosphoglycerate mutase [Patescibacteria group bacterium]
MKKGTLVIVRHGQSRFNELNIFTGWLDVPLSEQGIREAHKVADHCENFNYDAVFTSHLKRAHDTLMIILSKQKKIGVFQHQSDKRYDISNDMDPKLNNRIFRVYTVQDLNERAYGALQGIDKDMATKTYGKLQVFKWRRGFTDKPPQGESLKEVYERITPFFKRTITPLLKRGKTILIVGHGNTLRALVKYLENIEDNEIQFVNLPLGHPLVYEYKEGRVNRVEGEYIVDKSASLNFNKNKGGEGR